jgi:hypothetical protein
MLVPRLVNAANLNSLSRPPPLRPNTALLYNVLDPEDSPSLASPLHPTPGTRRYSTIPTACSFTLSLVRSHVASNWVTTAATFQWETASQLPEPANG